MPFITSMFCLSFRQMNVFLGPFGKPSCYGVHPNKAYPSSSQHSLLSSRFHWDNFLRIQTKILARLIAPFPHHKLCFEAKLWKIKGKDRGWTGESSNSLYKSQNYPSRPFEVHSTVFKLIKGLQQRIFFFFHWFNWGQTCVLISHFCTYQHYIRRS